MENEDDLYEANLDQDTNLDLDQDEDEGDTDKTEKHTEQNVLKRSKMIVKNIQWKSGSRTVFPIPEWKGNLPTCKLLEPESPLHYFKKMISTNMLENIIEQSNLYALQKNINKPLNMTPAELNQFIGSVLLMSIYGMPRTRSFSQKETRVAQIVDTISRNRWEEIKTKMHFNNNENMVNNNDKLYKIRPFINGLF
jgi:adenylate cyclase